MRRSDRGILALLLAGALALPLAGCATSALEMAPTRPDRPWTPPVDAEGGLVAGAPGGSDASLGHVLPPDPKLGVLAPGPTIDPTRTYSLAELIDIAQSNNPATRIAWNEARRAALAAGIAESARLPRVTATAITGAQSSSDRSSTLGLSSQSDATLRGTVSALSVEWLLFDFGERAAVIDAAKQGSLVSNIAFTAAHQQVIHDVALAFYADAAAQARLGVAARSLKNAEEVEAAAKARRDRGIGTVVEVAQAHQATAQAKLARVQAEGAATTLRLALLSATGIAPTTRLRVADVSGRRLSRSMMKPVEAIVAEAVARRPDVQAAFAAEKASRAGIQAAEAAFLPKIFVSANGSQGTGDLSIGTLPSIGQQLPTVNVGSQRTAGAVFVGVTVPVYDGGTRTAALERARVEADSAATRLARVKEEAVRQIAVADAALKTSLAALDAARELSRAAQTTFDAALAAYRSGVGSITDVTVAQTQLLQARIAAVDAHSTALSAAATLALATGMLGTAP